jgi:hypothetical protein
MLHIHQRRQTKWQELNLKEKQRLENDFIFGWTTAQHEKLVPVWRTTSYACHDFCPNDEEDP